MTGCGCPWAMTVTVTAEDPIEKEWSQPVQPGAPEPDTKLLEIPSLRKKLSSELEEPRRARGGKESSGGS
ncbi:hypothetical protein NQZ68_010395 [Dissostichus eleginoides]|nr:hypothetical protein NQZ68_010395 [Dissostichus eleginoides]